MSPRRTRKLAQLLAVLLTLVLAAAILPMAQAQAQEATPVPTEAQAVPPAETSAAVETPGTPTPTSSPTLTPTATPTLTEIQSRLTLAQAYLAGKDYDQAALLFAAVAEEDRGNAEALAGLQAALDGRAMLMATMTAPLPTAAPAALPPTAPAPTLGNVVNVRLRDFMGTAIAALVLVVLLYLLANVIRWLLQMLREAWYLRVLPLLRRPAIAPGYLIGEFINGLGDTGANAARMVPLTLTEKLVAWNQLVQAKEVPVEPEPRLDLGGMGWLKILWDWILPAPRGYRVSGMLSLSNAGVYQLAVQRTRLTRNTIDRSATFEKPGMSPETAFRALAGEAAKWLISPEDIEASQAIVRGLRASRSAGETVQLTPSEVFDQALELLLPVRQQVTAGAVDFSDARSRLRAAEGMLGQLPGGSGLRQDLQAVLTDLRRGVPAG